MLLRITSVSMLFAIALSVSAQTNPITKDGVTNSLQRCIQSNSGYSKYADARDTAYNKCSKELEVWFRSCSNGSIDAGPRQRCEQELTKVTGPIDKEWKLAHPDPPEQKDPRMESALQDFNVKHPLPGLPSLRKAVFLTKGSVVCSSPGAFANPNRDLVLLTGACLITPRDIKVSVLPPTGAEEYIRDHYFHMVAITWQSDEVSNGTVRVGWTQISRLRN